MVPEMHEQRDNLWDGVAIITGASSGIGEAIARKLAPQAKGIVVSARRFDKIEALAVELGDHVFPVACDVRDHEDVARVAESALEHFGRIDAIINNAGILPMASMTKCRVADWDNTIDTNIKGVLYGIASVLPHMLERGDGHIINMSSESGRRVFPGVGVYCATKHAVRAISEGLQTDLSYRSKKDGNAIKVTTIEPGVVLTNLAESVTYPPAKEALQTMMNGVEGAMTPEDIADCILYVLQTPPHVEIGEMIVRPVKQSM
jgi:NADP-dependent 3-hydroxy acid dehydrogenase YdfG